MYRKLACVCTEKAYKNTIALYILYFNLKYPRIFIPTKVLYGRVIIECIWNLSREFSLLYTV